ncbi:hypothetical protein DES36_101167 [Alkalibaculum bacchi]|uniref:FlgN protein n=1 Tax=Alkalibaculum bacchi TaxID=645887 RepID=A0A366IFG0_9FIRM|nr:hypothetical protein [Alkalibaculum bacchi]RBP70112.1 hypothetical protein DES36_101167 [Alkalibaculum bacchi]
MGADLENLLDRRNEILKKVIANIQSWDGEIETGIGLIEENKIEFDQVIKITEAVKEEQGSYAEDEVYRTNINILSTAQRELMESLQKKKANLVGAMKQVKKRNNVVDSYISVSKRAIFIDKDI